MPSAVDGGALPGGQPAATLEELFREHHEQVFRAAYRVTGSAEDAEDALQTVFLRLARRGRTLDLSPSPAGYLHRAAVNAALDIVRSRTGKDVALDDQPAEPPDPGDGPDGDRRRAEIRAIVRAALGQINRQAAEMFVLRYFLGYTNREIARLLATTPGSVAVALHRARAQLKRLLSERLGSRPRSAAEEEA